MHFFLDASYFYSRVWPSVKQFVTISSNSQGNFGINPSIRSYMHPSIDPSIHPSIHSSVSPRVSIRPPSTRTREARWILEWAEKGSGDLRRSLKGLVRVGVGAGLDRSGMAREGAGRTLGPMVGRRVSWSLVLCFSWAKKALPGSGRP